MASWLERLGVHARPPDQRPRAGAGAYLVNGGWVDTEGGGAAAPGAVAQTATAIVARPPPLQALRLSCLALCARP